jgi:serine/threonine protein kinase
MKIGQGGYGKIYRPYPIQCDHTKNLISRQDYIGKITNTEDISSSKMEDIQKNRKKIDQHNEFTIPYLGSCPKTPQNRKNPVWQWNKFNIQYLYQYGGTSLQNIDNSLNLLEMIYKLCIHISKMNKLGYYHLDIKDENILYSPKHKKLFLIDFDLSLHYSDIYKIFYTDYEFENVIYYIWPPEVNFGLNFHKKRLKPLTHIPGDLMFLIDSDIFTRKDLLAHINKYILSKSYQNLLLEPKKYDFSKIDIYSIGILLKIMIKNPNKSLENLILKTIESIPENRIDWDAFLNEFKKIIINQKFPIKSIKKPYTI